MKMILGPAIKNVGIGTYGTVDVHIDEITNTEVAVKTRINNEKDLTEDMVREISSLTVLKRHPNIIRLLDINVFNNPMHIVLDKAECSLNDELKNGRVGGDNPRTQEIMYHILRGMKWISDHGMWHRDLKTANILIMKDGRATIADFGLARGSLYQWTELTNCVFSLWWRPPEILLKEYLFDSKFAKDVGTYGPEAEMWAVGICFWQILSGNNRKARGYLAGENEGQQLWKILRAFDRPNDNTALDWEGGRKAAYNKLHTISDAWDINGDWKGGNVRSSFQKRLGYLLQDDTYKLLIDCLNLNPKKRINIENALSHTYFQKNIREQIDKDFPIPEISEFRKEYPRIPQKVIDDASLQILVVWLAEVREGYRINYSCLFLSLAILELFLAKNMSKRIRKKHFQLVGIASLAVAMLYIGDAMPTEELVGLCDNTYTYDEVIDMSKHIFSLVMSEMHLSTSWVILKNQTEVSCLNNAALGELLFFIQTSPVMKNRSYADIASLTANIYIKGIGGKFKDNHVIKGLKALVTNDSPASVKSVFGKVMLTKRLKCIKRM